MKTYRSRPNTTSRSGAGTDSLVEERVPAADREKLRGILIERGNGYLLKGWRREFDPDGTLHVDFQGFCQAASSLHFDGNYHAYFASDDMVMLEELVPEEGSLLQRFRQWVKKHFGGPAGMMTDYDRAATKPEDAKVPQLLFLDGCRRKGFEAEDRELLEIYHACDVDDAGLVTYDEAIFLELDPRVREMDMFRLKHKAKEQHEKLLAHTYKEELKRKLPQKHRLKVRPWLLDQFESLPTVVCQRRVARQRKVQRCHLEARIEFVRLLRSVYGNEVRAWRRGIDVHCTFGIDQKTFMAFCRKHDLDLDIPALWRSMDKDADGILSLEELCVHTAAILTSFRSWCKEHFGSCANLWDAPETKKVRKNPNSRDPWISRWPSDKKMLFRPFQDALRALALRTRRPWPGAEGNASWVQVVMQSLDVYGCHLISQDDLVWLDKWNPPEWISAEPDEAAWNELRSEMLRQYGHPLKAWRVLLDEDNSNSVSWMEFKHGAEKLKYKGNAVGAWRHLDKDLSGTISMKEYDPPSADLLLSFKTWAEEHFGSVETAFKNLDADGSGSLSLSELRKACKRLRWHGEVKLLFDCLDLDGDTGGHPGKRTLQLKEVSFLDSWGVEAWEDGEKEEFIQTAHAAAARRRSSVGSLHSLIGSSPATPSGALFSLAAPSSPSRRRSGSLPAVDGVPQARGSIAAALADSPANRNSRSAPAATGSKVGRTSRTDGHSRLHKLYHCTAAAKAAEKEKVAESRLDTGMCRSANSTMTGFRSKNKTASEGTLQPLFWLEKMEQIEREHEALGRIRA